MFSIRATREAERDTERQRETERDEERQRETETERDREREREKERERERESNSEAEIGFKYVEGVPLCTESSYPFTGADASCQASGCSVGLQSGSGTGYIVVSHTASALIFALSQGPILVAIEADQTAFQQYKSGVVSQTSVCFKSAVIKN